jgi:hypothetical protein
MCKERWEMGRRLGLEGRIGIGGASMCISMGYAQGQGSKVLISLLRPNALEDRAVCVNC